MQIANDGWFQDVLLCTMSFWEITGPASVGRGRAVEICPGFDVHLRSELK